MRGLLLGLVALVGLAFVGTASAHDYRYSGYGRGHYDYVPGHFDRHRAHYHYHPGHYEYHRAPSYSSPGSYRNYYTPGGYRYRSPSCD